MYAEDKLHACMHACAPGQVDAAVDEEDLADFGLRCGSGCGGWVLTCSRWATCKHVSKKYQPGTLSRRCCQSHHYHAAVVKDAEDDAALQLERIADAAPPAFAWPEGWGLSVCSLLRHVRPTTTHQRDTDVLNQPPWCCVAASAAYCCIGISVGAAA